MSLFSTYLLLALLVYGLRFLYKNIFVDSAKMCFESVPLAINLEKTELDVRNIL
jgi:hypothetical protein